jgi:hypothetical protein
MRFMFLPHLGSQKWPSSLHICKEVSRVVMRDTLTHAWIWNEDHLHEYDTFWFCISSKQENVIIEVNLELSLSGELLIRDAITLDAAILSKSKK